MVALVLASSGLAQKGTGPVSRPAATGSERGSQASVARNSVSANKEVPPASSLRCFPGAYYRKVVSSFDTWNGIVGVVKLGTPAVDMDRLGGLQKKMPWTGGLFLLGAAAISALPPLNGFAGEFLIYLGAFEGARSLPIVGAVPALAVVAGLALIGGLTAACFAKAFGFVFLGQPRSASAGHDGDDSGSASAGRPAGEGLIVSIPHSACGASSAGDLRRCWEKAVC